MPASWPIPWYIAVTRLSLAGLALVVAVVFLDAVPYARANRVRKAKTKITLASLARRVYSRKTENPILLIRGATQTPPPGQRNYKNGSGKVPDILSELIRYHVSKVAGPTGLRPWSGAVPRLTSGLPWERGNEIRDSNALYASAFLNSVAALSGDAEGFVDLDRARLFTVNRLLHRALEELAGAPDDPSVKAHTILRDLSSEAKAAFLATEANGYVNVEAPALRWISQTFNQGDVIKRARFFARQHILGDTAVLLAEAGLKGTRSHLWGKPYSLDAMVALDLEQRDVTIHATHPRENREAIVRDLSQRLSRITYPNRLRKPLFLILDDGGELISIVSDFVEQAFPGHAHLFTGVEQTTKGSKLLEKRGSLPFRVFDVGRSWAKTNLLSPVYGRVIAERANDHTTEFSRLIRHPFGQAGVIGYGAIGRPVAHTLRDLGYRVTVFDIDHDAVLRAQSDGFAWAAHKDALLQRAELLVTATGFEGLITTEDLTKLPIRAMVVNGGSEGEFSLVVPPYLDGGMLLGKPYRSHMHQDTRVYSLAGGKQVYVAEDGGVVNFPRDQTSHGGSATPTRFSQFDVGMLYLGMIEAMEGGSPGLFPPRLDWQKQLYRFVEDNLADSGDSFALPRLE